MSTIATSLQIEVADAAPRERERTLIFWSWCLGREAFSLVPQMLIVAPLILMELYFYVSRPDQWSPNRGRALLQFLFGVAAMMILAGGAMHAAQAVCWEVASELRELVRLTGIGPLRLLVCKSLARWATVACSLVVLLPLVCFALTLSGATIAQVVAYGWGLLMLAVLTASFAALASVRANSSQNTATTAATSTFILMLLYHMLFWLSNLLIVLAWSATGDWQLPRYSWSRVIYEFQWQAVPVVVIYHISQSPDSFSPFDPTYWIHFITAICVYRMAARVMVNRFASSVVADTFGDNTTILSEVTSRPRCGTDSFFWKDAYILSGLAVQRSWTVVYLALAVAIVASGLMRWEGHVTLVIGIVAECVWPVIFAMRVDSLLSAEFRQQTWGSLMVLPIERNVLLKAKLKAVIWEHRAIWLPVGLAIGFAFPYQPVAVFMTGIIASLIAVLLVQVSAMYYVTPHSWWTGPVQLMGALAIIVFCVILWAAFPVWASFSMTVTFLLITMLPVQRYIEMSLDDWHESPEYRSTTKRNE